jgi:hypothetical protein
MQVYIFILYILSILLSSLLAVVVSPFVSWIVFLKGKSHSTQTSSIVGALSGFIGTLIWPTGCLIWYCIENMNHLQMGGAFVLAILVLATGSIVIGAAVSVILTSTSRSR